MSGLDRKGYGEGKNRLLKAHAKRVPRRGRLAAIPDRTSIVKRLQRSIPILDGVVDQAVSPNRVDFVLVPTAKVVAIARHEAIRQRRPPADGPGHHLLHQLVLAVRHAVMQSGEVRGIYEIAVQKFGGSTQRI